MTVFKCFKTEILWTNSLSSDIARDRSSDQRLLFSQLLPTNVKSTLYVTVNVAPLFCTDMKLGLSR